VLPSIGFFFEKFLLIWKRFARFEPCSWNRMFSRAQYYYAADNRTSCVAVAQATYRHPESLFVIVEVASSAPKAKGHGVMGHDITAVAESARGRLHVGIDGQRASIGDSIPSGAVGGVFMAKGKQVASVL
jgi:hypothetical protein